MEASAWYERHRQGLGREFLDEVLAMLANIAETRSSTRMYIGTRGARLFAAFHSAFIFGWGRNGGRSAVMHASRNSHRWKSHV